MATPAKSNVIPADPLIPEYRARLDKLGIAYGPNDDATALFNKAVQHVRGLITDPKEMADFDSVLEADKADQEREKVEASKGPIPADQEQRLDYFRNKAKTPQQQRSLRRLEGLQRPTAQEDERTYGPGAGIPVNAMFPNVSVDLPGHGDTPAGIGFWSGANNMYRHATGHDWGATDADPDNSDLRAAFDQNYAEHPIAAQIGRGLPTLPLAMAAGMAFAPANWLAQSIGSGAIGAAEGAATADPGQARMGALTGGAAGMLVPAAASFLGSGLPQRMIAGGAQRFANAGRNLTRGLVESPVVRGVSQGVGRMRAALNPISDFGPQPMPQGWISDFGPEVMPQGWAPPPQPITDPAIAASRFAAGRPQFAEQAAERYRAGQPQFASPPMRTAPEAMPPHPTSFYATKPPLRHGTPNLDYVLEGFDPVGAGLPHPPAYNEYLDWASGGVTAPDPMWTPRSTPLGPDTSPVGDPFVSTPWGTAMSPEEAAYVQRVMSGAHGYGTPPIDAEFTVTPPRALPPPQRLLPAPKPPQ